MLSKLVLLLATIFLTIHLSNSKEEKHLQSGIYEKELKLKNGSTLRYTLSLPNLNTNEKVPLILALHYGGTVTPYYSREFAEKLVIPAFKSLPAIIVAPDCPGEDWRDIKSETAVLELLDKITNEFPIEKSHIVVTGYSRGGIGTWFMATKHPKLFSAAIPVSARPADEPDGTIPFYVIHSRQDELFSLELTEKSVKKLMDKGGKVDLQIVENIGHYETERFIESLSKSVDWLKKLWAKENK
jgi:predicted peptidase